MINIHYDDISLYVHIDQISFNNENLTFSRSEYLYGSSSNIFSALKAEMFSKNLKLFLKVRQETCDLYKKRAPPAASLISI
jgi:hypothetical protein